MIKSVFLQQIIRIPVAGKERLFPKAFGTKRG